MEQQNYNNHIRWYIPHHFVFYPIVMLLALVCVFGMLRYPADALIWLVLLAITILTGCLSFMMRQHYALLVQNRVVRLELRLRYYVLTQKRFEDLEKQLSAGQVYALRFASDEELPALAERAVKENLPGDAIKRAIKNWLPDHMRV